MADDRICVSARVRPLSLQEEECGDLAAISVQDGVSVVMANSTSRTSIGGYVDPGREATAFAFDAAFDSPPGIEASTLQEVVYEQVGRPVLQNALEGINGCLFAYGQTGSGKTFSMFGSPEAPGVLPLLAHELLEAKVQAEEDGEEFCIKVACLELYNENLVDLQSESREPLRLFENSQEGVMVPGLSETVISCKEEFGTLLDLAAQNRSVGATCVNLHSSRSHALIQLRMQWRTAECTKRAKIHLIDLAGSERQKRARNEGSRLKEGIHINVSLSALSLVISRLSEIAQGRNHCSVPFRDSKLTFLLKDSLSGNSRTQVLIALSPAASNYEESLSSLRFAQSVKKIHTRAVANIVEAGSNATEVLALQSEVDRLRAELDGLRAGSIVGIPGSCHISGMDASTSAGATSSNADITSAGDNSGRSIPSGDNESAQHIGIARCRMDSGCKFAGTYRSPQGTRVDVNSDGSVRFVGTEHHPIHISRRSSDDDFDCDVWGDEDYILQADGDMDYRYVLVSEDDNCLVWRHEPVSDQIGDALSSGRGLEFRWERVRSRSPSAIQGSDDPEVLPSISHLTASPNALLVAEALETLQLASSESSALSRVSHAVPSLARGLRPAIAIETVEALISLCADLDEANALLDRGADIGLSSSSVSLERPRMDATWLAPEPNQDMAARELLRVKVVWQACSKPRVAQVWSIFEFARWLEALRGPDPFGSVDETPRRAPTSSQCRSSPPSGRPPSGLVSSTPPPVCISSPIMHRSSAPPTVGAHVSSTSPGQSLRNQVSSVPVFGRTPSSDKKALRSPSPTPLPRPSPSPTPMPYSLEYSRSVPDALHDPAALQHPSRSSCSSPTPVQYAGRAAVGHSVLATNGLQDRRPRSADPGRDGRLATRDRASRRSPTPSGQPGSRPRSASAANMRPRLGVAAGPGDPCVAAKAFDKNSLRLRNGRIFVDALETWRILNGHTPSAPMRRLQPGMCAVFVRKRPMFERDRRRCDFDVLSVIRHEHELGNVPVGPEIVHHACMFDRSMVTPFIHHSQFPFDGVFDGGATNEDVYRDVGQPLLENALAGYLATLFVFGQTGSGKTYTMKAIERMAVQELFSRLDGGSSVSLTYFELAGRKALDLLTEQKSEIRLREEEDGCFRPHDCNEAVVSSADELLKVMAEAAARRATEATTVNDTSSRSHSVCRITINRHGQAAGRLLLVDCAGTEGSRDTLYFKGQHIKQSAEINSSLFALKDCIRFRQAAINRQRGLPQEGLPLRLPSVRATPLTKVLAESLISASAQLAAIATVSPNATDAEHTIETLRTVYTLSGRGEGRVLEERQVVE